MRPWGVRGASRVSVNISKEAFVAEETENAEGRPEEEGEEETRRASQSLCSRGRGQVLLRRGASPFRVSLEFNKQHGTGLVPSLRDRLNLEIPSRLSHTLPTFPSKGSVSC